MITIYCHTNTITGKKYVGQTRRSMYTRWKRHVSTALNGRQPSLFGQAICQHGPSTFQHEVLEECASFEEANIAEMQWIARLNSRTPHGYNVDAGGREGPRHPNTRMHIATKAKERLAAMTPTERKKWQTNFSGALTREERRELSRRNWNRQTDQQKRESREKCMAGYHTWWKALTPQERDTWKERPIAALKKRKPSSAIALRETARRIWATRWGKTGGPAVSKEMLEKAARLRADGALYRVIAEELGVKLPTLYKAMKEAGLVRHGGRLIASFGVADKEAWLAVFDEKTVEGAFR